MGKVDGNVSLRFLFANHDGVSLTLQFPVDATADSVKRRVMESWPENVEGVEDVRRFRLLCMGKELETSSTKTLRNLNIPVYDHPTPVNVSILPKSIATPGADKKAGQKQANAPNGTAGCCVVM